MTNWDLLWNLIIARHPYILTTACVLSLFVVVLSQIWMSVPVPPMTAVPTQNAQTSMDLSHVPAARGMLEMELHVKVSGQKKALLM